MKEFTSLNVSTWLLYFALIVVCTSPVWGVTYFVNQDGSGHLHTASLMGRMLAGNAAVSDLYTFNSIGVPNSSGHWVLLLLLQAFSAFTVTKIFVTASFALFVAGAGWLRIQTVGPDGLKTSLLIGAAMGFNWLWLVGFYNFTIGVIGLMFVVGFFYRRRDSIGILWAIVLALLLTLVYLSHVVTFLILVGSIITIILFSAGVRKIKTFMLLGLALLPVIPLAFSFKSVEGGGGFSPVWRSLDNPYSIISWLHQIRVVDPFVIISRKTFPFVDRTSMGFGIFTPTLWLCIGFLCLTIASLSFYRSKPEFFRPVFAFLVLAAGAFTVALFGPDDFSLVNGGVLRERFFICGMLFCIPLIRVESSQLLKRVAQFFLLFIIGYQTLALWEYALDSNRKTKMFLSANELLRKSPASAVITVADGPPRFHANPIPQLNCYNGIGNDNIIWDNYEFGHYLFPLVTKSFDDRHFIHEFTSSQYLNRNDPDDAFGGFDAKLKRLDSSLETYNDRIETIALWGRDARVDAMINKWFETEPYFENGQLRLFRHRNSSN